MIYRQLNYKVLYITQHWNKHQLGDKSRRTSSNKSAMNINKLQRENKCTYQGHYIIGKVPSKIRTDET